MGGIHGGFGQLPLPIENFTKYIAAGTATYKLTPLDLVTIVNATDATGNISVVLPEPARVPFAIFSVRLITLATSSVLVKAYDGSDTAATLATLDTSADWVVLFSDGYKWTILGGTYT
jgi:hypothetical protein